MAKFKHAYSSTSTVYAEQSVVNPDYDQILFWFAVRLPLFLFLIHTQYFDVFDSIAVLFQAQICDGATFEGNSDPEDFSVEIDLLPHEGGLINPLDIPEALLDAETLGDEELRAKIIAGIVPTVDTVFRLTIPNPFREKILSVVLRFFNMVFSSANYSAECNIIAWIFVTRLTSGETPTSITMRNWRGVWLAAIIIAQKVLLVFPFLRSLSSNEFTLLFSPYSRCGTIIV